MEIFNELSNRITSETPKFFKKLQALGLYLSTAATAVLIIPAIPDKIKEIAGYVLTAGLVLAAVSKLPIKDPDYSTLDNERQQGCPQGYTMVNGQCLKDITPPPPEND